MTSYPSLPAPALPSPSNNILHSKTFHCFPSTAMAAPGTNDKVHHMEIPTYPNGTNQKRCQRSRHEEEDVGEVDYSRRTQWLQAEVLGANDGLVSVSSVIMGVGAVKRDIKVMLLAWFAGLLAGACSMAIGEFVSVYTQLDIEIAQLKRQRKTGEKEEDGEKVDKLPNPLQATMASAFGFSVGGLVPSMAAEFIREHRVRIAVVVMVASLALVVLGGVGAVLGMSRVWSSCARVVGSEGGWLWLLLSV